MVNKSFAYDTDQMSRDPAFLDFQAEKKQKIIFKEKIIEALFGVDNYESSDKEAEWKILKNEQFETFYYGYSEFTQNELEKIKELIFKTDKYESVNFEKTEDGTVVFYLLPYVRVYRVSFYNNKKIYSENLLRRLRLVAGEVFNIEKLKNDIDEIKKHYNERGYKKTIINFKTEFNKENKSIDILYTIDENEPTYISSITISYVEYSTIHKLYKFINFNSGDIYDETELKKNLNDISDFLRNDYYLTAKVHEPEVKYFGNSSLVDIEININPGPRFEIEFFESSHNVRRKLGIHSFQKLRRIKNAIDIKSRTGFSDYDIELLSQIVANAYKDMGYYYATVKHSTSYEPDSLRLASSFYDRIKNLKFTVKSIMGEITDLTYGIASVSKNILKGGKQKNLKVLKKLKFEITPQTMVIVKKIQVHGSKKYSANKIKNIIRKSSGFSEGKPFSKQKLNIGLENLKGYYNANGFFNFRVSDLDYVFLKNDKDEGRSLGSEVNILFASLDIYIKEGFQSIINDIDFKGAENIDFKRLQRVVKIKKGDIYRVETIDSKAAQLKNYYNSLGYYYFSFNNSDFASYYSDFSETNILFDFDEGPIVYIGSIILKGNFRTKSRVITRKIDIRENEILTREKMLDSEEYLMRLGLFSSVKIYTAGKVYMKNKRHYHDLIIELQEADFKHIKMAVGYNTEENIRSFIELRHNNVGGAGRQARFKLKTNKRIKYGNFKFQEDDIGFWEYDILAGYREPSLAKRPFDVEIDNTVSYSQKKYPSYNIYRWEGMISFIKNALFTKHLHFVLSWQLTSDKIFGSTHEEDNKNITISSIIPEVLIDFRDSPLNPKKGFLTLLKYSAGAKSIGSTFEYWEVFGRQTIFIPLFWSINYFPTFSAGYIQAKGDDFIPIEKRYFLGGRASLRGYDEDGLGVKVNDSSLGGNAFWNFRNNFKFPLYGSLNLLLFYDMGQLYYENHSTTGLISTTGLGVLYESPIGAINLEAGFKLNKMSEESLWKIHFSIGNF